MWLLAGCHLAIPRQPFFNRHCCTFPQQWYSVVRIAVTCWTHWTAAINCMTINETHVLLKFHTEFIRSTVDVSEREMGEVLWHSTTATCCLSGLDERELREFSILWKHFGQTAETDLTSTSWKQHWWVMTTNFHMSCTDCHKFVCKSAKTENYLEQLNRN